MTGMVYFKGGKGCPTRLMDEQGIIGTFEKMAGGVMTMSDGSLVKDDKALIFIMQIPESDKETLERVRKMSSFGVKFHQVSHLPDRTGKGNIHQGATNLNKLTAEAELKAKAEANAEANAKIEKFKRYYQLESKLFSKDGKVLKSANPEELTQFEQLKQELEIN